MLGMAVTLPNPVAPGLHLMHGYPDTLTSKICQPLKVLAPQGFLLNPYPLLQELQLPGEEQLAPEPVSMHFGRRPLENYEGINRLSMLSWLLSPPRNDEACTKIPVVLE